MTTSTDLQNQIVAFVRAFGLHQPEQTPCGQPVSVAEAYALVELARCGALAQGELVERLNLAKSTVSRLVQQLVRRGWVERRPNPADGRSKLLRLTNEGQRITGDIEQARQQKFEGVLSQIPEGERDRVIHSLDTLVEAIHVSNQAIQSATQRSA